MEILVVICRHFLYSPLRYSFNVLVAHFCISAFFMSRYLSFSRILFLTDSNHSFTSLLITSQYPPLSGPTRRSNPFSWSFFMFFSTPRRDSPTSTVSSLPVIFGFSVIALMIFSTLFSTLFSTFSVAFSIALAWST